ncbi:MAG: TIGR04283 family arsenosugar biosynthesis glycosyltransferase [Acidobacteriota bacterium]
MPTVSIIIPTFNEERSLYSTIAALRLCCPDAEIIVADGESSDGTADVALKQGSRVVRSKKGRGAQLRVGAEAAAGDVLWFVHADTIPDTDALEQITNALLDASVVGGNFTVVFDGTSRPARFMSWLYPKLARLGLAYGDSGIFVRRGVYERVEGFKPLPLFEDLDLLYRIRREGKFKTLDAKVVTSSRRFEGRSFPMMFARWSFLQVLFWCGVRPDRLVKLYQPVRSARRLG